MIKNKLLFTILIGVILSISFVSSLQIKPVKSEFSRGETFLATINGNILNNIKKTDVGFYINNAQLPLTYDITKINTTYYIYAVLPYESRNYTLIVKNVYFSELSEYKKQDIEFSFFISNKTADFNVNPGFIVTTKNFEVNIYNNLDSILSINYGISGINISSINIPPQSIRNIPISISGINSTQFTNMEFSSSSNLYQIPLYVIKPSNQTSFINPGIEYKPISFSQHKISVNLNKDESYFDSIEVINNANESIDNIFISLSNNLKNYIFLPQNKIISLQSGEKYEVNFTAKFNQIGNYSGFIYLSQTNSSDLVDLSFFIGENVISNTSIQSKVSCSQLGGTKCSQSQFCSGGTNVNSLEGFCCLGQCTDFSSPNTPPQRNWIFVIIIIVILFLIGGFLFLKYRKPKQRADKILKEKEKSFSERFETSGKLSKV